MYGKRIRLITIVMALCCLNSHAMARDLAGIEWAEFKSKSEFIFSGCLIKAELDEAKQEIHYTYRISRVFKGDKSKKVAFTAPAREAINKTIGGSAIIALKKVKAEWKLSFDERSCWKHHNEMKEDFHGFPIYRIPTVLLYNFPKQLGEKVKLKEFHEDGYHVVERFVYPMHKVNKHLSTYLDGTK